ncbi:hypothetical protein AAE478_009116 [Parahypoxylon ruwenzoriense]
MSVMFAQEGPQLEPGVQSRTELHVADEVRVGSSARGQKLGRMANSSCLDRYVQYLDPLATLSIIERESD